MSDQSSPAVEQALAVAFAHLNRRDRTVAEMLAHLGKRGIEDGVAEAAVEELRAQGYLDDKRFAAMFAQDKRHLEQWGNDRIRRTLIGRGIPELVADAALAEEAPAGTWGTEPTTDAHAESAELERALTLLERRFPGGLHGRRESDRALAVLLRKGYEYELAVDALSEHRRGMGEAA